MYDYMYMLYLYYMFCVSKKKITKGQNIQMYEEVCHKKWPMQEKTSLVAAGAMLEESAVILPR